jgi:hypothetical protein
MSTEITVFTGDRDLVDRAKAQTQANRFARVDAEQQAKVQQSTEQLLQIMQPPAAAVSRLGGRLFRHLFFSEEPIARRNASTGLLAFLLVPTEGFDTSAVGPFGDPTGAQFTSYGASPGLVRGYTNTYWTVTNWRPYVGYVVVGGVWRNIGRVVPRPQLDIPLGEIDEISQQILPPLFQNGVLKGPILKSKRYANSNLNFHTGPWMERTISEVHIAHAVATRTNFRYRDDTSQQRLEYLDNTPLTLQPGARNAMTLEFIVQLGQSTIPEDGGNLRFNQGLPSTEIKGLNQLEVRLEGYTSGVWGQGLYDKFDLYLRQGHGNDADSTNLLDFEGGQSVDNDPESGNIVQYAENEVRNTLWRPNYDYDKVGNKTLVGVNGVEAFGNELGFPITFKTADSLAARPVHCALVFTNQQTRLYIEGTLRHTAPAAPRLLSAQTMRVYASLRDSAYKEYGRVVDHASAEAGGLITMNADLFGGDEGANYQAESFRVEWTNELSWLGRVDDFEDPGNYTFKQEFDNTLGSGIVPLWPLLSLNGVPTAGFQPGVKGRHPWTMDLEILDTSIRDAPTEMVEVAPDPVSYTKDYLKIWIYDQFGQLFRTLDGQDYTCLIIHEFYSDYMYSGLQQMPIGQTRLRRPLVYRIRYKSARTGADYALVFDKMLGTLIGTATQVENLDNPRGTIFNGPSRLSGIRLTSRELYTGNTVQVPSEITSLDPDEDVLGTPGGGGGGGGGGGAIG